MNALTLVKKLSILFASLAFAVVLVMGFSSGLSWDLVLLRGIIVFIAVLLGCLIVFGLAVQDRDVPVEERQARAVKGIEDIEDIDA